MILHEDVYCILPTSDCEDEFIVENYETSDSKDIDELLLVVRIQVIRVELHAHINWTCGERDVGS